MIRQAARPEPRVRTLVSTIAAARIGIGIGALLATRASLRALGFSEANPANQALARLAGGRDITIGALTLAARNDRRWLRTACLAAAATDAGDALTLAWTGAGNPELRQAGVIGVASGAAGALAGVWAASRLSEGR